MQFCIGLLVCIRLVRSRICFSIIPIFSQQRASSSLKTVTNDRKHPTNLVLRNLMTFLTMGHSLKKGRLWSHWYCGLQTETKWLIPYANRFRMNRHGLITPHDGLYFYFFLLCQRCVRGARTIEKREDIQERIFSHEQMCLVSMHFAFRQFGRPYSAG